MTSSFEEKIAKVKTAMENVFVKKSEIKNNLTSTDTDKPLSAKQGKDLNDNKADKIDITGTFTELKSLIDDASDGDTIVLDKDYKNTESIGITLGEKSLTISGNGHIIDFNDEKGFYIINRGNIKTLIFKGITFINANSEGGSPNYFGAAITSSISSYSYSNLFIYDCIFANNKATYGGAIGIQSSIYTTTLIKNCTFINNTATEGGAIFANNGNNNIDIIDCNFITSYDTIYNVTPKYFIKTSNTNGLVKNDGTIDTNTYLTQHQDISGKANTNHNHEQINGGALAVSLVEDTDGNYAYAMNYKLIYDVIESENIYYDKDGSGTIPNNELATLGDIPNIITSYNDLSDKPVVYTKSEINQLLSEIYSTRNYLFYDGGRTTNKNNNWTIGNAATTTVTDNGTTITVANGTISSHYQYTSVSFNGNFEATIYLINPSNNVGTRFGVVANNTRRYVLQNSNYNTYNYWKIIRQNNITTAYYSSDGIEWTEKNMSGTEPSGDTVFIYIGKYQTDSTPETFTYRDLKVSKI